MDLNQLKKQTIELVNKYPAISEELKDFYYLAASEIEEGGSEMHECSLAHNSMMDLIAETYE